MTGIKLCGLSRECDIEVANELRPEYIGFVFTEKSRRYVSPKKAEKLKSLLVGNIKTVGVFVNEDPERIAKLLKDGIIDIAQLHGDEDENYIKRLKQITQKPVIKAFRISSKQDVQKAEQSIADHILLDAGAGTGTVFDWELIKNVSRSYFLAGGLNVNNVREAVNLLHPFAVDVSSGIETDGKKDKVKMAEFVANVKKERKINND